MLTKGYHLIESAIVVSPERDHFCLAVMARLDGVAHAVVVETDLLYDVDVEVPGPDHPSVLAAADRVYFLLCEANAELHDVWRCFS